MHYGKHGRPMRRNRKRVNYEEMTDIQIDGAGHEDIDPFVSGEVNKGSNEEKK